MNKLFNIELIFWTIIIISVMSTVAFAQFKKQLPHVNIEESSNQNINDSQYVVLYNEFWQKFNTYAALTADYNNDSIVSQTEVDLFKADLLTRYGFIMHENGIFILDQYGNLINPDKMMCYLKNFKPKLDNQEYAFNKC